jgi:pimeloyl-ACP methyl ester carboxylesterase
MRDARIEPPAEIGVREGLSYALFLPQGKPTGGVVILHGAGSCKESHFDYARVLRGGGLAAVSFDMRGHGDSDGPMDERALDDVGVMVAVLRSACGEGLRVGLRGSSMGGYMALAAAPRIGAAAVVAICPAAPEQLLRGLRDGRFTFAADEPAVAAVLCANDDCRAIAAIRAPILLLHAEGDDQVPVAHSRELHAAAPGSRLLVVPGGHHRSIQHDPDLQIDTMRFLRRALSVADSA